MPATLIGNDNYALTAAAVPATNSELLACGATQRLKVTSHRMARTVQDGTTRLHFGDEVDAKELDRLLQEAPAGVFQGRNEEEVIGPVGKALKWSAGGTGTATIIFKARLVDANGVG